MIKVIKSETEYQAALSEIDRLLDIDPDPDSVDADRLELLTLLVENYESDNSEPRLPDPIDAIQFRMEQQNLTHRDLVPSIGSRSKVSEVLARKRPLTLQMIRALHSNLGIPAKVLLQEADPALIEDTSIDWSRFPVREMIRFGWIKEDIKHARDRAEEMMRQFFASIGSTREIKALLYRQTHNVRAARAMDQYALTAWTARVISRAKDLKLPCNYTPKIVDLEFMRKLAKQSWPEQGPLLAREYLANHGIALVVEQHLPKTHLDGAAIMISKKQPIIGLTIRYDRIDNFWFCLMHELAHLALHLEDEPGGFYDDLDAENQGDELERQADSFAKEALIPSDAWEDSAASRIKSPRAAEKLANELGIHPAIVAGRMRHEFKAYRLLNHLVGHRQVRRLFPEVNWR